ncbi:hypothetical protein ACFVZ4_03315 [Streptomyces goshikiensis]|uniref:hypothetical protein n=1 Tax=Streptomyces goshikiensis TaxID=1942 RepID=UPI0036CC019E
MQRPKITLIKLGSRDERREAYTNYLVAALALQHCLTVGAAGKDPWGDRDPDGANAEMQGLFEMYKHPAFVAECALAEMHMVATDPVLKSALVVRDVLTCVMREAVNHITKANNVKSSEFKLADRAFEEATRAYIAVCRKDLWYTPRWWQLHRQVGRLFGWVWKKVMGHGSLPIEMEKALDSGALRKIDAWGKLGVDDENSSISGAVPSQPRRRVKRAQEAPGKPSRGERQA